MKVGRSLSRRVSIEDHLSGEEKRIGERERERERDRGRERFASTGANFPKREHDRTMMEWK